MEHDACIALLEKKLSLDKQHAVKLLDAVFAGLVEVLVEKGEVSVKGLGYFKVVHIPFNRQKQDNAVRAIPPRKKITFLTRPVVDSTTRHIIGRTTGLADEDAEVFSRILSGYLRESMVKKQDLLLEGLGSFTEVDGKFRFVPDQVLHEIVNNCFEHLSAFEVPIH
jgi:nucleoid DNA-binding protein